MITVHHLNESRSQRILWLLEELGLDYEIQPYLRDEKTRLAPPELMAIHPLGKSPVISDDAKVIHESGAIVDYLVRLSSGKLSPDPASAEYDQYVQWLHYAEGSAMLPLMLKMYTGRLGDAAEPLQPRIDSEIANHLGYVEQALSGVQYLVGNEFSAADVQMSFVGEVAGAFGLRSGYPNIDRWVAVMHARPAYQAAIKRGGPYGMAN